ncbi:MAG: hypothetical protein ACNA8L_01285 [Luteolibacter sp.]|jgi:hypothetical protein
MAARETYETSRGSGFLFKVAVVFVALTISALLACVILVAMPQDLEGVGGLESPDGGRDVSAVLRESQLRQVPVTLTEAEINQWLARTLEARQGGRLEETVSFKRVVVRIREGVVEVVMEREFAGRPVTVSMYLSIDQARDGDRLRTELNLHGGRFAPWLPKPPRGGRFGSLSVPQGFLRLVMPSYEALADVLSEELDNGFRKMVLIRFEDKRIELDPRVPRRDAGQRPE